MQVLLLKCLIFRHSTEKYQLKLPILFQKCVQLEEMQNDKLYKVVCNGLFVNRLYRRALKASYIFELLIINLM